MKDLEKISALIHWLDQNDFKEEAALIKTAYGGGAFSLGGANNLEEAREWNEQNLTGIDIFDPSQRTNAVDAIQIVLDAAGLVPGYGEPADLANAVIYTIRQKYFEAALSLIALIPGLGIGATLLKRTVNKSRAISEIAGAARAANIDPARIETAASESLELLKSAIQALREELPVEYARRIPAAAMPMVKNQIDEIIAAIKVSSEQAVQQAQRAGRQVADSISEGYWNALSPAFRATVKDGAKVTVEKALLRSDEYLGPLIAPKIKRIFPDIDDDLATQIAIQCYEDIRKISINLIDTTDDMHRVFRGKVDTTLGSYSLERNIININLPAIAASSSRFGSETILTRLFSTIKHEINHNLDEIIGRAYHRGRGIPTANFDGQTGDRLRYMSDLMRTSPMGVDSSFSGIAGTRLGDSIQSALSNGALKGSAYLTDHGEIMTRFVDLKGFINNNGVYRLASKIMDENPRIFAENRYLYDLLVEAQMSRDVIAFLRFLTNGVVDRNWEMINSALRTLDYGADVADLQRMVDPRVLRESPELIIDIYNAI